MRMTERQVNNLLFQYQVVEWGLERILMAEKKQFNRY